MNEFDLPCTDCGTALLERTVPAGGLPTQTGDDDTVTIGVCPDCGARYYPERTLTTLSSPPNYLPPSNQ